MIKKKIKFIIAAIFLAAFFAFALYFNIYSRLCSKFFNHLTIYEQNSDNNYPKTVIDIPNHSGYLIAVYKDIHKLKLFKDNKIIKEYDVNIKRELEDRKIWEDSQTPEGIFKIESMDVISNGWDRWMRLDTLEKSKEIYKKNVKDGEKQIKKFEEEIRPIQNYLDIREFNSIYPNNKLLSGIGIHGGGFSLYYEWTQGCVAMSNNNVIELFDLLENGKNKGIGVPVIIQD